MTTVRVADGPALVLAGFEGEPLRDLDAYRAVGGYEQLEKARARGAADVIAEVIESNLRGRGGAFFPTGRKMSFIPTPDKIAKPIYITVNADESEPGTFKDREIMLKVPHRLIEGCLIAAHAIRSKQIYIYIRGEYFAEYESLQGALDQARDAGILADVEIVIHRGAGAYICGEETALLESLEGKRGQPRSKPPFPAISGRLRLADADQQRRVDHDDPRRPRRRPGGVRDDRRAAGLDRNAPLLPLWQRRTARRLRGAARDHRPPPDRGHRRRPTRGSDAEGGDDGRARRSR